MRKCDDGTECINRKKCKKTKPCWWMGQKQTHEIIARVALTTRRKSLTTLKRKLT